MEHTPLQKVSYLVLRMLGSLIFIHAGINHLVQTASTTARLEKASFAHLTNWIAPAETLVLLSGIGLLVGGLLLLVGYKTKPAALLLLAILLPITLTVQVASPGGSGPLFKNIALAGVLLFYLVNGARYYGLDQVLTPKQKAPFHTSKVPTAHFVTVLALGLLLLGSGSLLAQPFTLQPGPGAKAANKKYAVLISQPNHLKAAVHSAQTMTANSVYRRESFVVMACSKSVEAFVKGNPLEAEIRKGKAAGITYKLCGLSLEQFKIDPATLVDGVEVIPNGLTYLFELQQQGYVTVEL